MNRQFGIMVLVAVLLSYLVGCSGDAGEFGLGVNEDGESIAWKCDNEDPEHDHASDFGMAGVVLAKYFGGGAGARGCYHTNPSTGFTCQVSSSKKRKFVQDLHPSLDVSGSTPTSAAYINLLFGIAAGYNEVDSKLTKWNMVDNNAQEFRMKAGYNTGLGGSSSFASGGLDGTCTSELAGMPNFLTIWSVCPKSKMDFNLDKLIKFAKDCYGSSPTTAQYQAIGKLGAIHETMHGIGFAHTSSNVNGVMKAQFACSDVGKTMSAKQVTAANDFTPGDWDDGTLVDIGLEH